LPSSFKHYSAVALVEVVALEEAVALVEEEAVALAAVALAAVALEEEAVALAAVALEEAAVALEEAALAVVVPRRDAGSIRPAWRNCMQTSLSRNYARGEIAGVIFAS
jgi:hypothetical protein